MKLKNKAQLAETLYTENYDVIVFFEDGTWNKVSTGTDCSNDPLYSHTLSRAYFYDVTKKQVKEKIAEMEDLLDSFQIIEY